MTTLMTQADAGVQFVGAPGDLPGPGLIDLDTLRADPGIATVVAAAANLGVPLTLSHSGPVAQLTAAAAHVLPLVARHALAEAVTGCGHGGRVILRLVSSATQLELRVHTFCGTGTPSGAAGRRAGEVHAAEQTRLVALTRAAHGRYAATPTAAGHLTRLLVPATVVPPAEASPATEVSPTTAADPAARAAA